MIIIIVVIIIIIMIIKDMYCANEPMHMIKWVLHTNLMAYKQKHVKSKKKLVPHQTFKNLCMDVKKKLILKCVSN